MRARVGAADPSACVTRPVRRGARVGANRKLGIGVGSKCLYERASALFHGTRKSPNPQQVGRDAREQGAECNRGIWKSKRARGEKDACLNCRTGLYGYSQLAASPAHFIAASTCFLYAWKDSTFLTAPLPTTSTSLATRVTK